jgi:S1-C subfamily serine protease
MAAPADLAAAVAMVEPAVVRIDTVINYQHAIGAGTGIIIDGGGAILTNSTSCRVRTASPRPPSGCPIR